LLEADRITEQVVDRLGRRRRRVGRKRVTRPHLTLLRFEDEAVALIKVDPPRALGAEHDFALDRRLELVVAEALAFGVGRGQAERVAQLGQEHLIIGSLGAAFPAEPFLQKIVEFHALPRFRCHRAPRQRFRQACCGLGRKFAFQANRRLCGAGATACVPLDAPL
jgi:hypothetical protein